MAGKAGPRLPLTISFILIATSLTFLSSPHVSMEVWTHERLALPATSDVAS